MSTPEQMPSAPSDNAAEQATIEVHNQQATAEQQAAEEAQQLEAAQNAQRDLEARNNALDTLNGLLESGATLDGPTLNEAGLSYDERMKLGYIGSIDGMISDAKERSGQAAEERVRAARQAVADQHAATWTAEKDAMSEQSRNASDAARERVNQILFKLRMTNGGAMAEARTPGLAQKNKQAAVDQARKEGFDAELYMTEPKPTLEAAKPAEVSEKQPKIASTQPVEANSKSSEPVEITTHDAKALLDRYKAGADTTPVATKSNKILPPDREPAENAGFIKDVLGRSSDAGSASSKPGEFYRDSMKNARHNTVKIGRFIKARVAGARQSREDARRSRQQAEDKAQRDEEARKRFPERKDFPKKYAAELKTRKPGEPGPIGYDAASATDPSLPAKDRISKAEAEKYKVEDWMMDAKDREKARTVAVAQELNSGKPLGEKDPWADRTFDYSVSSPKLTPEDRRKLESLEDRRKPKSPAELQELQELRERARTKSPAELRNRVMAAEQRAARARSGKSSL